MYMYICIYVYMYICIYVFLLGQTGTSMDGTSHAREGEGKKGEGYVAEIGRVTNLPNISVL